MKIPYNKYAYVSRDKIEKYILSPTHLKGKHKALVFRSVGFNIANADLLIDELLMIVHTCEITQISDESSWKRYRVDGSLHGPNGRVLNIRTAWCVDDGKRAPRFVTAFPL